MEREEFIAHPLRRISEHVLRPEARNTGAGHVAADDHEATVHCRKITGRADNWRRCGRIR